MNEHCGDSPDGEHDCDVDDDTLEYVCNYCGEREPIPLDRIIRD
jgi:hypothetical protein